MLYPKDPAVKVQKVDENLLVEWKLPIVEAIPYALVAICAGGAAIMMAVLPASPGQQPVPVGFPITAGLGAIGAAYFAAIQAINRNKLWATKTMLISTFGPLPAARSLSIDRSRIKQLFAVAVGLRSPSLSPGVVYVMESDDIVRVLAKRLPSTFAANQIAHEIEDFYGIEDMPIYGVTTDPSHPGPRVK